MKLAKQLLITGTGIFLIGCEAMNERKDHAREVQNVSSQLGDTQFEITVENIGPAYHHILTEVMNTPVGKTEAGPIEPGESYEFSFKAGRGQNLSLFTMVAASNDLFISPENSGIALYDSEGNPRSGDITAQLLLWDAGTEHNQPLGEGSDQPCPRLSFSGAKSRQSRKMPHDPNWSRGAQEPSA